MLGNEIEDLTKVGSRFPEEGRDQCVQADDCQRPIQLKRYNLSSQSLTASRRTEENHLARRLHAVAAQDISTAIFLEDFLQRSGTARRENNLIE
ncbi:hypothetical protein D3C71_1896830 [compost metagenome]